MNHVPKAQDAIYFTKPEAADYLRQLEEQHGLFQYRVDGYSIWQLVRSDAGLRLINLTPRETSTDLKVKQPNRFLLPLRESFHFFFARHADYVVRTAASALREKDGDHYKDLYFDDLIREAGSAYKIETLNSPLYHDRRKQALIPSAITTSTLDFVVKVLARLPAAQETHRIAGQLSSILRVHPALQTFTPRRVLEIIQRFYWLKRLYRFLLWRIHPRCVLVENTRSGYAIWAAAQELGILTVEVQHGVFYRNHPDVLSASAIPYRKSLIVPDRIFLFGEHWKNELRKSQFYDREPVAVGSPHIDRYRQVRLEQQKHRSQSGQCVIVLTTQGLSRDSLIQFVADFLRAAQGKLDYSFYIKLHPGRELRKSVYEEAFGADPNVHILLGSEDPSTYELLAKADFHLSVASASHYDALGLGVPTIVLAVPGHETVLDLVDAGHAWLAHTPQDLLTFIRGSRTLSVSPEVSAYYFTPGAVQNMVRELKSIEANKGLG